MILSPAWPLRPESLSHTRPSDGSRKVGQAQRRPTGIVPHRRAPVGLRCARPALPRLFRRTLMDQPASIAADDLPGPVPLSLLEQRILGVLVEKQKTTADAYPMSVNALVTGSNQKSNRDPLLNLSDLDVEETLERCLRMGLVQRIQGGRVERWKHLLYEAWQVDKLDLAVLAELLLRGPQ